MRVFLELLALIVLVVASSLAFAGGSDLLAPPAKPQRSGVYVDLAAGYAAVDWGGFGIGSFNGYTGQDGFINSNVDGGFTFGFDVGYQINNIIGLEAGWYYLPTVKGNSDIANTSTDLTLNSWLAYLAAKFIVPFTDRFNIFGKVGLAYRSLRWRGNAIDVAGFGDAHSGYISGIFGAGLQYYFNDNFSVSAQYLYILDNRTGSQPVHRAPAANLIVGTIAYIFPVS